MRVVFFILMLWSSVIESQTLVTPTITLFSPWQEHPINLRIPEPIKHKTPVAEVRFYQSNMLNIRNNRIKLTVNPTINASVFGDAALRMINGGGAREASDFIFSQGVNGIVKYNMRVRYRITQKTKFYTGFQVMSGVPFFYFGFLKSFR